jgi:hypothetical protein
MDDKNKVDEDPHAPKGTVGSTLGGAVAGAVAGTALGAPVVGTVIGAVSGAVFGAAKKRAAGTRQRTKSTSAPAKKGGVKEENVSDPKKTEDEVGIGCDKETIVKEKDLNEQPHGSRKDGRQKAYA